MRRTPALLVVSPDDPPYLEWLRAEASIRRAYTGDQATASLDDSVDAVLFDGPVLGTTVGDLADRAADRDCDVVAVTRADPAAVPPTVTVVEEPAPASPSERALLDALPGDLSAPPVDACGRVAPGATNDRTEAVTAPDVAEAIRAFLE